ncbi:MAG: CHASE2 domain-containing protein [Bryobacteraceae bacterium]
MRRRTAQAVGYGTVLASSFLVAMLAGWLGAPIDNYAYDWMFRHSEPRGRKPESILLAVDERSLTEMGGMRGLRRALADGLDRVAAAGPSVVAIDLILADEGDPAGDAALEAALQKLPRLVLASELIEGGRRWEDPLPRFRRSAAAVGHVHGDPGPLDGVSRVVPLAKAAARDRRWALALEAFRLSRGAGYILESPDDLEVGAARIPARYSDSRALRIRYVPPDPDGTFPLPRVSLADLKREPQLAARFHGKVVFVGVTAQSAARDRMLTPYSYGLYMPGIEIHANIFETLARGEFLVSASNLAVALLCLALGAAAVAAFAFRSGWQAYALAALVLTAAHVLPYVFFTHGVVFPYFAPVSAAWLAAVGAGSFQFVTVRRQLGRSEAEKTRYQQAMHFVTHEMRTPLTAIQGSSELMSRYKLSEEKRRQIADLITSESKRLARMIETFLSVERLSAGQMDLKQEIFDLGALVATCLERARPLAESKQIRIDVEPLPEAALTGDRELMEYAVYNLLSNAVKYSPAGTIVRVSAEPAGASLRLGVRDQGIGMDADELKSIFQKFYRTKRAVASGEKGTGIGLSIVEQIVTHHGGRIEVSSAPGQGSCFTLVLPARISERAARLN